MKSQSFVSLVLLFICVLFIGCKTEKKPDGMPEIYPTEITIHSEGKALAEANVSLFPLDLDQKWTAGGTTNSSGVATMQTFAKFPGAPEGKFKVCVSKTLTEPDPNADPNSPSIGFISFDLVDTKYGDSKTSDFEIEIVKGQKNKGSFDVGPAIKKEAGSP